MGVANLYLVGNLVFGVGYGKYAEPYDVPIGNKFVSVFQERNEIDCLIFPFFGGLPDWSGVVGMDGGVLYIYAYLKDAFFRVVVVKGE